MDEIRVECDDAWIVSLPCEGEVQLTLCPYEEDVNNKQVPAWLCTRHLNERIADI
jgi:hypothetical protein